MWQGELFSGVASLNGRAREGTRAAILRLALRVAVLKRYERLGKTESH